jgi:hypothetical protein
MTEYESNRIRIDINNPQRSSLSILPKSNRAAIFTHRSVDEIVTTTADAALTPDTDLPDKLEAELAAMHLFSDKALWVATYPLMSAHEQQRLA